MSEGGGEGMRVRAECIGGGERERGARGEWR